MKNKLAIVTTLSISLSGCIPFPDTGIYREYSASTGYKNYWEVFTGGMAEYRPENRRVRSFSVWDGKGSRTYWYVEPNRR